MANKLIKQSVKNLALKINNNSNILKAIQPNKIFSRNDAGFTDSSYTRTSLVRVSAEEGVPLQITNFNEFGFQINSNIRIIGPMVVFPKTIFSWNIANVNEINEKSLILFKHIEPKIDILVLGIGDKYSKIDPNVPKWLIQNKINNFEILPTDKAINVFNFLIAENRFAAAALIPSSIIREVDASTKRIFEIQSLYREEEPSAKLEDSNKEKSKKSIDSGHENKN